MVKFDPICADGASVGWNYISGASHGKKMVYRWWLDQEFGTIFFHDHLFANYRQKDGLFGALFVEPAGAKFWHPKGDRQIVRGLQARIEVPGREPVWFREFGIGIGDFIPMWDKDDTPLNPPEHPGGHGDQGVMALNYRSDPIHERLRAHGGDGEMVDPALWFTSREPYNRDPQTTLFETIAGDPVWYRVVQGSHEEQHSFQVHGMRWRRFRDNAASNMRNQQSFGISEAFTFVQEEPYGPGDYMYKLSSSDDLWLGCWGVVRASATGAAGDLRPLPNPPQPAPALPACTREAEADLFKPVPGVRKFFVVAEQRSLVYRRPDLVDPFAIFYRLERIIDPVRGNVPVRQVRESDTVEPLVLRCREGETVKVYLKSNLPPLQPEPFAPEVPVETRDPSTRRPRRRVSQQVSMHADLVRYDVTNSDGATVGLNPRQTVGPDENWRVYCWQTDRPPARLGQEYGEPVGPLLLQDMADFRNHRHHGLIGALIVEPADARPLFVTRGNNTANSATDEAWDGPRATLLTGSGATAKRTEEAVLLMQDGLRLFLKGNLLMPIPDEPASGGEDHRAEVGRPQSGDPDLQRSGGQRRQAPPDRVAGQAQADELHGSRRRLAGAQVPRQPQSNGRFGICGHHRHRTNLRVQRRCRGRLCLSQRSAQMGSAAGPLGPAESQLKPRRPAAASRCGWTPPFSFAPALPEEAGDRAAAGMPIRHTCPLAATIVRFRAVAPARSSFPAAQTARPACSR
jgi:hypothetical protein